MKCYLIVAMETDDDAMGLIVGRRNSSLTSRGTKQAERLAGKLMSIGIRPAMTYSSSQFQAMETGKIITSGLKCAEPMQKNALRERFLGGLEGQKMPSRKEFITRSNTAEALAAFQTRLRVVLTDMRRDHSQQMVIVVTHPLACLMSISLMSNRSYDSLVMTSLPKPGDAYQFHYETDTAPTPILY